ncbi:MAG: 30S ribosomal protein S11 [Rickettsiales bacterium]|jgi:small subunit ribosomal protein S11|nr:30S ribosomal protein S11 [Rickettsiales bacterium]
MADIKRNDAPKKRERKNITNGIAYILATFNNTRVTITDIAGNVIAWSTAGANNFAGAKKSTPYAAQVVAENAGKKAMENGIRYLDVKMEGPGSGREAAVRTLQNLGITINGITDITKIPHNGCRAKKPRRV